MSDPTDTPLPRAARRLLLETMQRGEQSVAAVQRDAQAAFQAAAQDVLADLGIPAGAASELVRDGQGRPVAIRWVRPEPTLSEAEAAALAKKLQDERARKEEDTLAHASTPPLTSGAKDEPAPPEVAK